MSLLSLSPTTSSSPSSLPNYAGPHQPASNPPPSSSSRQPRPPSSFAASGSSGPNRRPSQRLVPTIEREKDLGRRRRLAASMLGPSVSIRERPERGRSSVERGEASSGEGRGSKDVGAWVAGVEKVELPRIPSEGEAGEGEGESSGRRGGRGTTTSSREEATAVADLRGLLEKALSEVGSSESIPPALTPPLFPPPPTINPFPASSSDQPTRTRSRSSSPSSVESADDEEDWLVVRPRAERDATRTTNKFLELGWKDGNIALDSTTSSGLVEADSTNDQPSTTTVPSRLFPQRASTELISSTSNRPLPPLPPPSYLPTNASKSNQDGDDAYTFKASLFAGLDAKTNTDGLLSSPPPPSPFRSHTSPTNTSTGAYATASLSPSSFKPRDQDDEKGGEGSGTAGRGAAKLRSLFFAGKLGGGKRKEELGLEYRRVSEGKSSSVEPERQSHHTSSFLPSSLAVNLNPFRRSSSPSSSSQRSTITPYTYGVPPPTPTSTPDAEASHAVVDEDDVFDLPRPLPPDSSTPPIVSRLAGGSSSGAYVTHGEISRRLEEMEDDESRRVWELWLV